MHEDNTHKLAVIQQGMHAITKYFNPFIKIYEEGKTIRDNNELHRPSLAWAMENMETSTLKKMTKKAKETLESAIRDYPVFIANFNISYPLKESSLRWWIENLDFKYSAAKNSYMITVHERLDMPEDKNNVI